MSEKIKFGHEQGPEVDDESFYEEHRKSIEEAYKRAGHEASKAETGSIDKILDKIEKEATPAEELDKIHTKEEIKPIHRATHIGETMKQNGYTQTMKKVQRQLPPTQKRFSKIIHNPTVEQVSNVGGQTIARPSGLLWGGIFSVIANLLVILVFRYYGYEYNYLIGIVSFVGGFCFGILLEGLHRTTSKKKSR